VFAQVAPGRFHSATKIGVSGRGLITFRSRWAGCSRGGWGFSVAITVDPVFEIPVSTIIATGDPSVSHAARPPEFARCRSRFHPPAAPVTLLPPPEF